jgi:GTPase SAR1 family protein
MPEISTQPAAMPALNPAAVRIVLFGMPDAGKSSLLGALRRAAQTQEHVLNGHLLDRSQGLAELQRRLYEDRPRETLEEIVPYPVTLESFTPPGQPKGNPPLEAVLIDCDGRVANELLTRQDYLNTDRNLARAILDADTLILLVDASASSAQLERDFSQFGRFLDLLEKSRGRRSDVGGLPVYLVLTKCDLLAQPRDTSVTWIDRIEERKRQVGLRFKEFLSRQVHPDPLPFGSIDLHFWATAVKRPALAETPAKPRDPYGVAELFRQCLESARHFHKREVKAGVRLQWTLIGSAGLLALLALLAAYFFLHHAGGEVSALQRRVETYRAREQDQAPETKHAQLEQRMKELAAIEKDPGFETLPEEEQEYVRGQRQYLADYKKAFAKFKKEVDAIPYPEDATTEKELDEIEDRLREIRIPKKYQAEWSQTLTGKKLDYWKDDIKALRLAVRNAEKWYQKLLADGKEVLDDLDTPVRKLRLRAKKVLDEGRTPPWPEKHPNRLLPGAKTVSYAAVHNFATVAEIRSQWEKMQEELERKSS